MRFKWLLVVFITFAFNACSGGGSSDGSSSGGPEPIVSAPTLTITSENAEQTAVEVIGAIESAFSASGSALDFGGAIGARIETGSAAAANIALDMAQKARDSVVSSSYRVAVGVVITETQDCTVSGSSTVSIDTGTLSEVEFANALQEGTIPAGTSVSTFFTNCAELDQPPLNGGITIVFQQFSTDGEIGLDAFTFEFGATFDNLESAGVRINGDINFLLVSNVGMTDFEISGNALEIDSGADSVSLFEFVVNAAEDSVALVESFDFILSTPSLGQVTVETFESWVTHLSAINPISGTSRILGAQGTSITMTALDEVNVQLEVDTDGDGVPNVTIITTWDDLNTPAQ